ncbi:WXG100 family type VII secretion target [Streptomyces sp. NPDC052721]|uniref:WXG100 family type VII secretion target n=1 Tax=Streptomyces sp. NPDC052721 TaxID=3154955 RepID=UPI00342F5ECD
MPANVTHDGSNLSQDFDAATRGVQHLTDTQNDINNVVTEVEESVNVLTAAYGGADGAAFRGLLDAWRAHVREINQVLGNMANMLQGNVQTNSRLQVGNMDQIQSLTSRTNGAFEAMGGRSA